MGLKGIEGQEHAVRILLSALETGRVSHAYLFYGPEGSVKRALALELAKALNCQSRQLKPAQRENGSGSNGDTASRVGSGYGDFEGVSGDACDLCPSCLKVAQGVHPDVHLIEPQGATVKIEQLRRLQGVAWLRVHEGRTKVFIIDQAETMTPEAGNSLLKILEDPPGDAVFILLSGNPQSLLPTIQSRCQKLQLEEVYRPPADSARRSATAFIRRARAMDELEVLVLSEEWEKGKKDLPSILEALSICYRDVLVFHQMGDPELLIDPTDRELVEQMAGQLEEAACLRSLEAIERARSALRRNANTRLVCDVLLFRLRSA